MIQSPEPPSTVEDGIASIAGNIKQCAVLELDRCKRSVREEPLKAMLIAVGAGYCLNRLPLRAIFVTKMRVLAALAPPALLAIGAAKLAELLQQQAHDPRK